MVKLSVPAEARQCLRRQANEREKRSAPRTLHIQLCSGSKRYSQQQGRVTTNLRERMARGQKIRQTPPEIDLLCSIVLILMAAEYREIFLADA